MQAVWEAFSQEEGLVPAVLELECRIGGDKSLFPTCDYLKVSLNSELKLNHY